MKRWYSRTALLLLVCILGFVAGCTDTVSPKTPVEKPPVHGTSGSTEETIWALEYAYFADLYQADYDGVLGLVHPQYLGWPDGQHQPVDYNESSLFMRKLITKPAPCTVSIDRKGIRVQGDVVVTQYVLNATCSKTDGSQTTKSSDITHTWVKEGPDWKILGGMSRDW